METQPHLQASMDALSRLLRDASLVQARQYFGEPSITLGDDTGGFHLGQVLKRYMAIVILISEDLRVVIKLHFDPAQVRSYKPPPEPQPGAEVNDQRVIDFMKELANQTGGRVCRAFDANEVSMGMSVPLCTRGIYELYADYTTRIGAILKFGDFWRIDGPFGSIFCSCYFEASPDSDFTAVHCPDDTGDEGELDFL